MLELIEKITDANPVRWPALPPSRYVVRLCLIFCQMQGILPVGFSRSSASLLAEPIQLTDAAARRSVTLRRT